MKLKNPDEIRQWFAERKDWYTVEEIADGLEMSSQTISNALRGKPMRPDTVKKLAEPLGVSASEIATFIK